MSVNICETLYQEIRNEILRRMVCITSQIDMNSYQLWLKHFLCLNIWSLMSYDHLMSYDVTF